MTNFNRYLVAFAIFMTTRYGMVQLSLGKSVNMKEALIKSAFFALALYFADTYMPPKSPKKDEGAPYLG